MTSRIPMIFRQFPRKKEVDVIKKWHIFRGDTVEVLSGPHKKKQGVIKEVIRNKNQVIIEGLNLHYRYVKSTPMTAGKMYTAPGPIHYSNVNLVDPSIGKPTRIAIRYDENGKKLRISKKTGTIIPIPEVLKTEKTQGPAETGLLDTPPELVLERTVTDEEL